VSDDLRRCAVELDESAPRIETRGSCPVLHAFAQSWAQRRIRWHVGHQVGDLKRASKILAGTAVDVREQWKRAFYLARWAAGDALPLCLRRHDYLPGVSEALEHVEAAPTIVDGMTARDTAYRLDDAANALSAQLADWSGDDSAALSVRDALMFLSVACTSTRAAVVWVAIRDADPRTITKLNEETFVTNWCPGIPCEFPEDLDPNELPANWEPEPRIVGYFTGIVASQVIEDVGSMIRYGVRPLTVEVEDDDAE
jgi:hypothetical protein